MKIISPRYDKFFHPDMKMTKNEIIDGCDDASQLHARSANIIAPCGANIIAPNKILLRYAVKKILLHQIKY